MDNIPVIHLTGLRSGDRAALERIGTEIGAAARGLGFFSVADHGIPQPLIDAVFSESAGFFALPDSEKQRLSVSQSTSYRGYVKIGEEKLDPALAGDIKECFNAGPDLASDDPDVLAGKPYHAVNQWPARPEFRATLMEFHRVALELVVALHRAIATDLKIEESFFDQYFTEAVGVMRLLHYPPHPGRFDGSVYGAGAHTDYGNLTLLAQDAVGGLEVRTRDGGWIAVPPLAGTLVCNIGDCLMRWTNDAYVSNAHRVVNQSGRERYSVAYFGDPNSDALVTCLPSCLGPGELPKYPPITYAEYLRSRYEATYTVGLELVSALIEDVHAGLIENGVPPEQQRMALDKVFWSHFSTNLAPATWVLGALLVGIGLDFRTGLLAILIGNVLGSLPVGINATIGPRTGLTQIEISRFAFGRLGTRVPSALNWFCAVGWDAVNNVPSVLALLALVAMFGLSLPFWLGLCVLVAIQLVASIYGHHVVQVLAKYLCYVLIVVFAITGIVAVMKGGSLATVHEAIKPATFVLGVSIIAGFDIGFAPYTADYTRYLPRSTNPIVVFALAFGGIAISSTVIEIFGLLTASRLSDLSPHGVISGIAALTGPFAPVALIAIAASAISINSINDNTAAYSMISAGVRIPRHIAAIVTTACGFALAVAGAGKFAELFSNYLLLLLYWIAPWAGIVITDWWLFGKTARPVRAWGAGATIFAVVTPLTIALFSSTEIYTGPLAKMLGGTDIGFFVGFFGASMSYALVERRTAAAYAHVPDAAA